MARLITLIISCSLFLVCAESGLTQSTAPTAGALAPATNSTLSLEDERAISAVLLRYATAIDRRDWTLFETCFTEDLLTDYGSIGSWKARKPFVDYMTQGHAKVGPTMHRLTNFVISGQGDHAVATSYVDALLLPLEAGKPIRRAEGRYEDQLVRVKGEWRISNRKFVSVRIADLPS